MRREQYISNTFKEFFTKKDFQNNNINYMKPGYIKLSRKFFLHDMWCIHRTFSRSEAWLDLIQSARYEDTPITSRIGNYKVTWGRGQYPISIRNLSRKWDWSEKKVRYFLKSLQKEQMITIESIYGVNIITLCNYEDYNECSSQSNETSDDNSNQKAKKSRTNNSTKKNDALTATLSRKELFYSSLIPFVGKYSKEMIRDFFDYWSEMNRSCTKMRFEQQPTWEVGKRLATWASKDNQFSEKNGTGNRANNQKNNQAAEQRASDAASIVAGLLAEDSERM